ncbi:hypothetical protein DY000_02015599 [Brassica cretica]|uniref:Uncharacterized protein n=1 Tax=Brassica cretica TaxID=69181 RepID=A0ABQ7DAQ4_BRACR|nr:hypothetical protein DY000_02015599 [Brassica cretica]
MKKGARIGAFPRGTIMRSSLKSIPDPNKSLGVKADPQREQHHDSGVLYLSDLCSRLCCIALE